MNFMAPKKHNNEKTYSHRTRTALEIAVSTATTTTTENRKQFNNQSTMYYEKNGCALCLSLPAHAHTHSLTPPMNNINYECSLWNDILKPSICTRESKKTQTHTECGLHRNQLALLDVYLHRAIARMCRLQRRKHTHIIAKPSHFVHIFVESSTNYYYYRSCSFFINFN